MHRHSRATVCGTRTSLVHTKTAYRRTSAPIHCRFSLFLNALLSPFLIRSIGDPAVDPKIGSFRPVPNHNYIRTAHASGYLPSTHTHHSRTPHLRSRPRPRPRCRTRHLRGERTACRPRCRTRSEPAARHQDRAAQGRSQLRRMRRQLPWHHECHPRRVGGLPRLPRQRRIHRHSPPQHRNRHPRPAGAHALPHGGIADRQEPAQDLPLQGCGNHRPGLPRLHLGGGRGHHLRLG